VPKVISYRLIFVVPKEKGEVSVRNEDGVEFKRNSSFCKKFNSNSARNETVPDNVQLTQILQKVF